MLNSTLKKKLTNGQVAFGTFVKVNSPSMVEMLGFAGFDFIITDCEHSGFSYSDLENMIRSADGVGLSSVIRISSSSEEHILHALDLGAGGVQIPGLSSIEEVKEALSYAKYYPQGKRGLSFAQRAAQYGFEEKTSYISTSNKETTMVIHIENKSMAERVEELCQIPEVDVLFIGPADLSQSMGKPGAMNDPEVVAAIEKVIGTAKRYKKCIGIYVASQADLKRYVELGATYIAWQSDVALFVNAVKEAATAFEPYR